VVLSSSEEFTAVLVEPTAAAEWKLVRVSGKKTRCPLSVVSEQFISQGNESKELEVRTGNVECCPADTKQQNPVRSRNHATP
jgi:hypothetical protein